MKLILQDSLCESVEFALLNCLLIKCQVSVRRRREDWRSIIPSLGVIAADGAMRCAAVATADAADVVTIASRAPAEGHLMVHADPDPPLRSNVNTSSVRCSGNRIFFSVHPSRPASPRPIKHHLSQMKFIINTAHMRRGAELVHTRALTRLTRNIVERCSPVMFLQVNCLHDVLVRPRPLDRMPKDRAVLDARTSRQ